MFYPMFPIPFYPQLPTNCIKPPTLYALLNAIANFDSETKTKIKDLALATHEYMFDFNYPLTNKVNKTDFEVLIIKHFLMRRIGYETFTSFKLALDVKLNEIMPFYNKMFDMLDGWDLFNDGEDVTRTLVEGRDKSDTSTNSNTLTSSNTSTNSQSTNNTINNSKSENNLNTNTSDRRFSDTPQNALSDVQNGTYVSNYNYDTTNDNERRNTISSETNVISQNIINNDNISSTQSSTGSNLGRETTNTTERIIRTPADKIRIYTEFLENRKNIYSLIFRDLDPLFYGLV